VQTWNGNWYGYQWTDIRNSKIQIKTNTFSVPDTKVDRVKITFAKRWNCGYTNKDAYLNGGQYISYYFPPEVIQSLLYSLTHYSAAGVIHLQRLFTISTIQALLITTRMVPTIKYI
jgi:hypothetical protein